MFLKYQDGTLEVITGPMCAGKSEELIKRIKILEIAGIKTLIFKPQFDNRFSDFEIVSRNGSKVKAHSVTKSSEILNLYEKKYKAVVIDEIHFFDEEIIEVINKLTSYGVRVIVSGLDMDYLKRPFPILASLLAIADEISKLKAVCVICKGAAGFSFRKTLSDELKLLGDKEYEARCRHCHDLGMKDKNNKLEN